MRQFHSSDQIAHKEDVSLETAIANSIAAFMALVPEGSVGSFDVIPTGQNVLLVFYTQLSSEVTDLPYVKYIINEDTFAGANLALQTFTVADPIVTVPGGYAIAERVVYVRTPAVIIGDATQVNVQSLTDGAVGVAVNTIGGSVITALPFGKTGIVTPGVKLSLVDPIELKASITVNGTSTLANITTWPVLDVVYYLLKLPITDVAP